MPEPDHNYLCDDCGSRNIGIGEVWDFAVEEASLDAIAVTFTGPPMCLDCGSRRIVETYYTVEFVVDADQLKESLPWTE